MASVRRITFDLLFLEKHHPEIVGQCAAIKAAAAVEVGLKGAIPFSIDPILNPARRVFNRHEPPQVFVLLEGKSSATICEYHAGPVRPLDLADDFGMPYRLQGLCIENRPAGSRRHQIAVREDNAAPKKRRQKPQQNP